MEAELATKAFSPPAFVECDKKEEEEEMAFFFTFFVTRTLGKKKKIEEGETFRFVRCLGADGGISLLQWGAT